MRLTRRGTIAQRKGGAFVWAVYSLVYGIDESAGGTSGSFSLSSSRYKRVAKSYTVSADGTVSLTSSAQTTAANMAVGDYLVNVSTSNNTSTTGTTLYKITAISGSTTRTISYTAYTPTLCAMGSDTGDRVKSVAGTTYPHYGAQGNYFYVLLRGLTTVYKWNIFRSVAKHTYEDVVTKNQSVTISTFSKITVGTFDTSTGKYSVTYNNANVGIAANYFANVSAGSSCWVNGSISSSTVTAYYYGGNMPSNSSGSSITITGVTKHTSTVASTTYSKGTSTGNVAESIDSNAYPQDGRDGADGYWYVYAGAEERYIDNT